MKITQTISDGVPVFALEGKLDVQISEEAQRRLMPALPELANSILDMRGVDYVSSSGLRVLMMIAKKSAQMGGRAVLVGVGEAVWDVMEMTGFDSIFSRYDDVSAALAALKGGQP